MQLLEPGYGSVVSSQHEEIAKGDQPTAHQLLILIGDFQTNPRNRELAGASRIGRLTAQVYCRRPILLEAGGSQASVPGAGGELLI